MSHPSRLPNPYMPEGPTVDARLASLQGALEFDPGPPLANDIATMQATLPRQEE